MNNKKIYFVNLFIILIVSFLANYYYGSIGVFPIDTFAYFDSSNLINKGFLPIRDFWTSNGFLVDLIQSVFFKLFNVSWKIYLLHSSLVNFIFSFLTYNFLKQEGLNSASALFYSLSVSILAYPIVGVPFPDQHSLLLSIIAVYFLIFALKTENILYWSCIPLFLAMAFLSKQVPSAFFLIQIILIMLFFLILKKKYYFLTPIICSSIITILIFYLFLFYNNINIQDFLIQYIYFPLTIGADRTEGLSIQRFLFKLVNDYKFFLIIGLIIFFKIYKKINLDKKKFNFLLDSNFIFITISFIAIINQILMKNQNMIFFLLPILIGLVHTKTKIKSKKNIFLVVIILFNIFVTTKYHYRFNVDRKFMDLQNIEKTNYVNSEAISSKLKGLKWVSVASETNLENEVELVKDSIEYLKKNKDHSFIITYYQFILSEIDHNLYSPNRWYTNDGVSYPLKQNKYRNIYENFYIEKLIKHKIQKIFTLYPLEVSAFNSLLRKGCIETTQINKILHKHELFNCYEKEK